jgi:hypothetical protein
MQPQLSAVQLYRALLRNFGGPAELVEQVRHCHEVDAENIFCWVNLCSTCDITPFKGYPCGTATRSGLSCTGYVCDCDMTAEPMCAVCLQVVAAFSHHVAAPPRSCLPHVLELIHDNLQDKEAR